MAAPVAIERGPFSYDSYTLTSTTANNVSADRTFSLSTRTQIDPDINETLEVLVNGVKLKGSGGTATTGGGDEFFVNSLTTPTTLTIVPNATLASLTSASGNGSTVESLAVDDKLVIRRISNRTSKNVDYAPGSVIREIDLDSSNTQIIHIAQEAMDTAIASMVLDTDDEWEGQSKEIKNVAAGTDALDAVNYTQLGVHDADIVGYKTTTLGYREDTEDYKLETEDWATKVNGVVNTYTDNDAQNDGTDFSAKAWSIGGTGVDQVANKGSAKQWAVGTGRIDDQSSGDYSAKVWATGGTGVTNTSGKGSAKDWATDVTGPVDTSEFSAKSYASIVGAQAPTDGSAKEWATTTGEVVASSEYSAKEYSQGSTVSTGSAKQWALGGGSFVEGTAVEGSNYSARKYASDASASETAAANSAAAVSQVYDNFNDVYLGAMRTDKSSADAVTLTNASWAKDSSSIAFTGIDSGTVTIGQELTTTGTGYPVDANIIGSQLTTPIVISKPFTVASPSPQTLVFVGTGVYGAFNSGTGGPAANNDGDALVNGNLYFNSQENEMRIWQGAEWIAATAVGQTSLLEYKFVTTSGQVSSKTYSGTADVGGTLSYTQGNIIVFMNGVQLKDTTDYTATNSSSVVLVNAPVLNDEINIIAFKSFTTADMVSKGSGGTFSGAVTFGAGLTSTTIDATTDFTIGGLVITDNTITDDGTLTITATTGITLGQDTALAAGKDFETSTQGKVKQKGAFMQSSTHQVLTLGG